MSYGLEYSQKRWDWRVVGTATYHCLVKGTGTATHSCETADMHDTFALQNVPPVCCLT